VNAKPVLLGTAAYTLVTFPIAVLWHVVLFADMYGSFAYIEGEPKFLVGFATILLQGFILSWLYPRVAFSGSASVRGLKFATAVGLFFWTSHVLAFVAKNQMTSYGLFITMESIYLAIQFGVFGLLIGRIYRLSEN
jgi:hypothetical protein